MKRTILLVVLVTFFLSSLFVVLTYNTVKAEGNIFSISSNRLLQDQDNPNLYYFVGMVYYEVWSNSGGQWTGAGHHPKSKVPEVDGGTYEFTFGSNRKVKSISVEQFNYDWKSADGKVKLGDLAFEKSRAGELKENPKKYYQNATSKFDYDNYGNTPVNGLGSNKASKKVFVLNGILEAKVEPVNRREEERIKNGTVFAPGVEGFRYYFPTLFKIELEPAEGMAIIQHFDTKGNPLNGIDGFTDKEMKLEKGKDYTFPHTAPGEKYTYEGHKKSTRETYKTR